MTASYSLCLILGARGITVRKMKTKLTLVIEKEPLVWKFSSISALGRHSMVEMVEMALGQLKMQVLCIFVDSLTTGFDLAQHSVKSIEYNKGNMLSVTGLCYRKTCTF